MFNLAAAVVGRLLTYSQSNEHIYYSGYVYSQLHPLVVLMFECCEDPTKHHSAIYEKYQDKRYKCASTFVANEMGKGFKVPDVSTHLVQTFRNFYDAPPWETDGGLGPIYR